MHDLKGNLENLRIVRDLAAAGHAGSVDLACVTQSVIDLIEDRIELLESIDDSLTPKKTAGKKTTKQAKRR